MEKLFFVWLNFDAFGNSDKFICTEKQVAYFESQLSQNREKVFLSHSKGRYMVHSTAVHTMRIEEAASEFSEKILFEAIETAPQRVLTLALEKLVGGILSETVGQQKAYLEKITEHLKGEIRVGFLEQKVYAEQQKSLCGSLSEPYKGRSIDPNIPTVDEMRALNVELAKRCSMEKYDPKDDRVLTKPHCCVHEHGLMREATPEERLAAIKKAS